MARAGRFGTKGLAITFVSEESDATTLNSVQDRFEVNITELPDELDVTTYSKLAHTFYVNLCVVKSSVWCDPIGIPALILSVWCASIRNTCVLIPQRGVILWFCRHKLCPCGYGADWF